MLGMSRRTERIICILHLPKAVGRGPIPRCIILQSDSGRRVQLHRVDVSMQCDRGSSLLAPATFIGAMDGPPDLGIGWQHHGLHRTGAIEHCDSGSIDDAAFVGGGWRKRSRGSRCLLPLTLPQGEEKVFQSSRHLMRLARRNAGTRLAARARQRHPAAASPTPPGLAHPAALQADRASATYCPA